MGGNRKSKISNEKIEKLIEQIRMRPNLWNQYDENYRLNALLAWKEISEIIDVPVEDLKCKWKGLKWKFIEEKKKRTKNESCESKKHIWQWYSNLMFLSDTITDTERRSSLNDQQKSFSPGSYDKKSKLEFFKKKEERRLKKEEREDDEFTSFFKSLLPHVRKSNDPLEMKMAIMRTVQEVLTREQLDIVTHNTMFITE